MTQAGSALSGLSLAEKRALLARLLREREQAEKDFPLSFGQRAWWFLDQLDPANASHLIVFAARLASPLDHAAFARCLARLSERHEILRTTYRERDGEPRQRLRSGPGLALTVVAAEELSETSFRQALEQAARSPFDLRRGPPCRLALWRRPGNQRVLLLAVHHIAADLWSLALLLSELAELYAAELAGCPARLAALTRRYVDYAASEAERLSSPAGERLWRYWQEQLGGELPRLALPTDRPRPPQLSDRGASWVLPIDAACTGSLRTLAREQGTTLFAVLLAAFQLLLACSSGQRQLLVGTLLASGRASAELGGVVGFFDNPVALRGDLAAAGTFLDLLDSARRTVLAALEHQSYPFSLLVERLKPQRERNRAPIFQTMLILQRPQLAAMTELLALASGAPGARASLGGLRLEGIALDRGSSTALAGQLDLVLTVAELGEELLATFQYPPDLFDATTVARLGGHFRNLLAGVPGVAAAPLERLRELSPAERWQLVAEWNDVAVARRPTTLAELVAAGVAEHPARLALVDAAESVSYAELWRRSGALAARLAQRGVGPEVRVGIRAGRSAARLVAVLAVLRAGGAYVPLDPLHPAERTARMVLLGEVRLVLSDSEPPSGALPPGLPWLELGGALEAAPSAPPAGSCALPEALAYILFTSGSTGEPKGVMIEHAAAANTVLDINQRFAIGPEDRVLAVSSLGFDLSVYDLFGPLAAGGAVVVPPPTPTPDPATWLAAMVRHGVTVWNSAPALLEMLEIHLEAGGAELPQSLRLVMLSGDWIGLRLPEQARRGRPSRQVVSLGGATEASIWSILFEVGEVDPSWSSIPYGRPMENQPFHVLDRRFEPVPIGVTGELYIAGLGLARGYAASPARTAERFLPDPHGPEGSRLYRTGDLGRRRSDGTIEFLGRADHQLKIRGFRIEPGEIEAALRSEPRVREALVVARRDLGGGAQLVAYYTASGKLEAELLGDRLRRLLPDYMVPGFLVELAELPLTPNGKLDRAALPRPEAPRPRATTERGPLEELLVAMTEEVLELEGVALDDNFFALGGHSLTAARLTSRLRESLKVELPISAVFEAESLATLARSLRDRLAGRTAGELPPLVRRSERAKAPLSFAQERLWVAEQMEAEEGAYNLPGAALLSGPLEVEALGRALAKVVARHEVLRSAFVEGEDGPLQQVAGGARLAPPPVVDLRGLAAADGERERLRLTDREGARGFRLEQPPLLRALLLRLGSERHQLVLTFHHLVADGGSMAVLLRELSACYQGAAEALPELPVQFGDFAAWQRRATATTALEAQLEYWRRQLAGAPLLELPLDRPRQAGRSLLGGSIERLLPGERLAAVKNLARREGATLFMTLLAAFYATLHRTSGQRDLVLGTDLAHRNHRALEGLIGFFVDHPVLRVKVEPGKPARELLQAVKRTTLEAYARQDVPFEHLVEQLEPERLPGVTPLFQVLFVLQEPLAEEIHLGSCRLEPLAVDGGRVKFDLVAMAQEEPAGLRLTLRYARSLFDASTLERLARDFDAVLAELCANPDRPLEQFSLPSQAEGDPSAMEAPPSPSSPTGPRAKRRRAVALDAVEPVRTRTVTGGATRAFVFEPESPDVDLPGWVASARAEIDARLAEAGALLFRGFPLASVKDFERVATALCPSLYDGYGDLPRADLGDRIYQSTPYPEDLRILFHNESSHLDSWPWHQMFFCVQPSATGGETPITDCREVYRQMDPALCQRFEEQGLLYVRNFIAGVEPSWQSFFKTDDRDRVAEICRESRLEIEWQGEDGLRTKKRSPAVIRHPVSGEKLFFNQIQAHHVSCLDPATRESLEQMVSEAELPRNVYFGDGSPIPDATVMELIDLYDRLSLVFPWQKGDLVVVDNMLIAHARNSFTGPRKITVAMGDMVSLAQLDPGRGA